MKNNLVRFITAVTLSISFSVISSEIWQQDANNYIALESNPDVDSNAHPVSLDEVDILTMLHSINVKTTNSTLTPMFTEHQQRLLARYIAKGLHTARPDQDLVFALAREHTSLAGLKTEQYFVSGRIFFANNLLNVIIGDHEKPRNRAYEMAYDPTNQGLVEYDFNLGSRSPSKFGFNQPLDFASQHIQLKYPNRSDWITLDLTKATRDIAAVPAVPAVHPKLHSSDELPSLPKAPLTQSQSALKNAPLDTLIERFKALELLKKNKLISENEYRQKRRALLDEI